MSRSLWTRFKLQIAFVVAGSLQKEVDALYSQRSAITLG